MDPETIKTELARLPNWGSPGIECGIRAGFRCEYCGRDLLASLNDYKSWQQDHLVPESLGGANTFDNMVVACHPCNAYKSDWDPRAVADSGASREVLIEAARNMIHELRQADQAVLERVHELVDWAPSD